MDRDLGFWIETLNCKPSRAIHGWPGFYYYISDVPSPTHEAKA
jgi:hypothetical protein